MKKSKEPQGMPFRSWRRLLRCSLKVPSGISDQILFLTFNCKAEHCRCWRIYSRRLAAHCLKTLGIPLIRSKILRFHHDWWEWLPPTSFRGWARVRRCL